MKPITWCFKQIKVLGMCICVRGKVTSLPKNYPITNLTYDIHCTLLLDYITHSNFT